MNTVEAGVANFRSFHGEVRSFITRADTRDEERELTQNDRHRENANKLSQISLQMQEKSYWVSVAAVIGTIAGVLVAIAAIIISIRLAQHSEIDPMKLFHSSIPVAQYAQESQIPPLTR